MEMSKPIYMFDQWRQTLKLTANITFHAKCERDSEFVVLRCYVVERDASYKLHQQMVD